MQNLLANCSPGPLPGSWAGQGPLALVGEVLFLFEFAEPLKSISFYSMVREWRRGVYTLKAPSGREESVRHQKVGKRAERARSSWPRAVPQAPLHQAQIMPSRVQVPPFWQRS